MTRFNSLLLSALAVSWLLGLPVPAAAASAGKVLDQFLASAKADPSIPAEKVEKAEQLAA